MLFSARRISLFSSESWQTTGNLFVPDQKKSYFLGYMILILIGAHIVMWYGIKYSNQFFVAIRQLVSWICICFE